MSTQKDKISGLIQVMRTLTLAQLRKQLEYDERLMPKRYEQVTNFFSEAKEQQK